jgi:kinesin family member 5
VAVRLRPRNSEELVADADFGDCVELQPEVRPESFFAIL